MTPVTRDDVLREPVAWLHKLTQIVRFDKPSLGLNDDYTPLYAAVPPTIEARVKGLREAIASAIYGVDPFYEGGEYVDGFAVSPGGNLSWEQALQRDAECASVPHMGSVTKFSFDAADAVLSALEPVSPSAPTQGVTFWRSRYHDDRGETWMSWSEWFEKSRHSAREEKPGYDYEERTFYPSPSAPTARQEAIEEAAKVGIYIASKTKHAGRWRALRDQGVPINSTWIDEAGKGESQDLSDLWRRCLSEASDAAAIVVYREPDEVLKGGWVELGAAASHGVPVFAVGLTEFTISKHRGIQHFDTFDDALAAAIRSLTAATKDQP